MKTVVEIKVQDIIIGFNRQALLRYQVNAYTDNLCNDRMFYLQLQGCPSECTTNPSQATQFCRNSRDSQLHKIPSNKVKCHLYFIVWYIFFSSSFRQEPHIRKHHIMKNAFSGTLPQNTILKKAEPNILCRIKSFA